MTITRADVLRRARTIWRQGSVPYSMDRLHSPDGYRQDCSGYVCMAWGIPLNAPGSWGGLNTVTLVSGGWMREIPVDSLQPGDAVGRCGPGTGGADGHIQLFVRWVNQDPNNNQYVCLEQAGGGSGWQERTYDIGRNGYKAYRYKSIVDGGTATPTSPSTGGPVATEEYDALMRVDRLPNTYGDAKTNPTIWLETAFRNMTRDTFAAAAAAGRLEKGLAELVELFHADRDNPLDLDALADLFATKLPESFADTVAEKVAQKLAARMSA